MIIYIHAEVQKWWTINTINIHIPIGLLNPIPCLSLIPSNWRGCWIGCSPDHLGPRHGSDPKRMDPKSKCNLKGLSHTWSSFIPATFCLFVYQVYITFGYVWLCLYNSDIVLSLQTGVGVCGNVEECPATASDKNRLEKSVWLTSYDVGWRGRWW